MRIWSAAAILLVFACPASAENAAASIARPASHEQSNTDHELCVNGHYPRSSELCAQWKAADAARDSANWALVGAIVAAIGSLGLFSQVYLTRRALGETRSATAAMLESNRIAHDANRGFLAAIVDEPGPISTQAGSRKHVDVSVRNIGKSDCLITYFAWAWVDSLPISPDQPILSGPPRSLPVGSGETVCLGYVIGNHEFDRREYLIGVIKYRTTLNPDQRTHLVYEVAGDSVIPLRPDGWPTDT